MIEKKPFRYAYLIPGFIATARENGLSNLWAALPASDPIIRQNRAAQIRKVKDHLASGVDCLGNVTILTVDGFVKQL
jgi:hypothetical protein